MGGICRIWGRLHTKAQHITMHVKTSTVPLFDTEQTEKFHVFGRVGDYNLKKSPVYVSKAFGIFDGTKLLTFYF